MTSAKEIARAYVEMVLSDPINYLDVEDLAHEYDPDADVHVEAVYERVLEYMVEIRENFKNGH